VKLATITITTTITTTTTTTITTTIITTTHSHKTKPHPHPRSHTRFTLTGILGNDNRDECNATSAGVSLQKGSGGCS
jgi:hypothetical protein